MIGTSRRAACVSKWGFYLAPRDSRGAIYLPSTPNAMTKAAGFSLMEAVVATLIVGVMLVAALRTVAASRTSQLTISDRAKGQMLAKDLMAEILTHPYIDPQGDAIPWVGANITQGETAGPGRSLYDDIDDFNFWSKSPPEFTDGTAMPDLTDWTRSVNVYWADPADLSQPRITDTGVKYFEVTVKRGDRVVATLATIRT